VVTKPARRPEKSGKLRPFAHRCTKRLADGPILKQLLSETRLQLDARFRRPLMSYFLRRLGNRSEAEDLTQQVFVRVLAGEMAELENPQAYIFTVASNLLKDRGRATLRRGGEAVPPPEDELVDELLATLVEERSPERVLLGKEALAGVLKALDELGERTRDIFILFRLENMKQAQIASLFGISQSTVEKHVMRATAHLALRRGDGR
jgi:RNA polymerase sigma factor (sigma-70 family)